MKETLKYLRGLNKFSQNKVAKYLGISRQMYIKYETGETEPTVKVIRELCKLYKVPYDVIIDDKYNEQPMYPWIEGFEGLYVTDAEPAYSTGKINADSLNYRQINTQLSKLNSDELIKIASRALKLVEEQKKKAQIKVMSQKEKMELFSKLSGSIKNKKIEDYKSEKIKYLDERYGV